MNKLVFGAGTLAIIGTVTGIIMATKRGKKGCEDMKSKAIEKIESINDVVQNKTDKIKGSSADVNKKACQDIREVQKKKEHIKKDIDAGYKKVKKDIHITSKNLSKDLKSL